MMSNFLKGSCNPALGNMLFNAHGNFTQRSFLGDKTQSFLNSARLNSVRANHPQNQTMNTQIKALIDQVKDFLKVKVRLKDPLDDNAHLIPSSRYTGRTAGNR